MTVGHGGLLDFSTVALAIPGARRAACGRLVAQQLIALDYALAAPRIPGVRSAEAAAKVLRDALTANERM